MKKFSVFSVCLCLLALGLVMGCTTTDASISGARDGSFPFIDVAAKDFTGLGLVFAETEVERHRNKDSVTASGEVLTHYALLKEAQKLGADGIVNVIIDIQIDYKGVRQKLGSWTLVDTGDQVEKWFGSALAVKYGNKLIEGDIKSSSISPSSGNDGSGGLASGSSDSSPSGRKWYNPFTWFRKG